MTLFQGFGAFAAAGVAESDFELLTSATIPSGTSFSVDNVFTTDYSMYQIVYAIQDDSNNQHIRFRLRAGGSDATGATDYKYQQLNVRAIDIQAANFETDSFPRTLSAALSVASHSTVYVFKPAEAEKTGYIMRGTYDLDAAFLRFFSWSGYHDLATAYDGFTIDGSTTTTFEGAVRVYGWRK